MKIWVNRHYEFGHAVAQELEEFVLGLILFVSSPIPVDLAEQEVRVHVSQLESGVDLYCLEYPFCAFREGLPDLESNLEPESVASRTVLSRVLARPSPA